MHLWPSHVTGAVIGLLLSYRQSLEFYDGVNAGQHEGGGKSLEIRRFGFNATPGYPITVTGGVTFRLSRKD
ncbi:MAG TPA: hypothetical protein VFY40_06165 [Blastocatellia bacterium]|nr:hypothetical protein [Blastocatellia bacterium]